MNNVVMKVVAMAVLGAAPLALPSQQDMYASMDEGIQRKTTPRTYGISVQFDNTPFLEALRIISERGKVSLLYTTQMLPNRRVTYRAENQPVRDILEQILTGSGLRLEATSQGGFALLPTGQPAYSQGTITGKVIDAKTKQPVAGVTIAIDGAKETAVSGNDGTFRISAAMGQRTLQARKLGYVRHTQSVNISADGAVSVEIILEPSASVLDEVIVTGTVVETERKALPTPITVIKGEDLEKRGITRINQLFRGEVPGLLALEAGAYAYGNSPGSSSSVDVYSRGVGSLMADANPIKTYVDGVELLDPSYLGTLDPQSIERIEIITGPQAATIYGSGALGGVMQIFTKRGAGNTTPEVRLTLRYGILQSNWSDGKTPTHNDAVYVTGGLGPAFSYSANASYVYSGQWRPGLFSRTYGASLGASYTQGPITVAGAMNMTNGVNGTWSWSYGGDYGSVKKYEDGEWWSSGNVRNYFATKQQSRSMSQTQSLNVDYRVSDIWQHHLTVGRTQNDFKLDPVEPNYTGESSQTPGSDSLYRIGRRDGARTTASYNTTLQARIHPTFATTLTAGGNTSVGRTMQIAGCSAEKTSAIISCYGSAYNPTVRPIDDDSWGVFTQGRLDFFNSLFLTVGLRGEHNSGYGKNHQIDWTPTHGITYTFELNDLTVKLLGSYGRATRAPDQQWRQQVVTTNSSYDPPIRVTVLEAPDLRPERSRGSQGGLEIYYGSLASLTVNHYQQKIADVIERVVADSIYVHWIAAGEYRYLSQNQYQNTATIRQIGWEGTGSLNLGPVTFKGTYFWNDSRVLAVDPKSAWSYSYVPGDVFLGVPTHAGNLTIGYASHGVSASLVSNYVGSMYSDDNVLSFNNFYARQKMYVDVWVNRGQMMVRRDAYIKSDFSATKVLTPMVSLVANVINLENRFSSEAGSLNPALGRQTMLGVSLRWR